MDGLHFTVIVLWRHGQTPSLSRWRFDISAGDRCARNFLLYLRRLAQLRPLLDVVDQGEQLPLAVNFLSAAQREAAESLVVADVSEDRFDGCETSPVLLSTECAVDARAHGLRVRRCGFACEQRDLPILRLVGLAQTLRAQGTVATSGLRRAELHRDVAPDLAIATVAMQLLASRTNRMRLVVGNNEISGTEHATLSWLA